MLIILLKILALLLLVGGTLWWAVQFEGATGSRNPGDQ
jgi:hypothetical protein